MRVCEVKNHFGVYQNYTFLSTTVYITTRKMVLTLINTSKNEIFYFPKHSYLSITVYIKGMKCHFTFVKYKEINSFAFIL